MEPLCPIKNRRRVYTPNGPLAPKQRKVSEISTKYEQGENTNDTVKHQKASTHWESVAARLGKSRAESGKAENDTSELPKKLAKVSVSGKRTDSERKEVLNTHDPIKASGVSEKSAHPLATSSRIKQADSKSLPLQRQVEKLPQKANTTKSSLYAARNTDAITRLKQISQKAPNVTITDESPHTPRPDRDLLAPVLLSASLAKPNSFWGPSGPPPRTGLPYLPPEIAAAARKALELEKAWNRSVRAQENGNELKREVTEFDLTFCPDAEEDD